MKLQLEVEPEGLCICSTPMSSRSPRRNPCISSSSPSATTVVEEEEGQVDWQELHQPLLSLVQDNHLSSFADYIRVSGVCSWWRQVLRSSVRGNCSRPRTRPNLPLLVCRDERGEERHTIYSHDATCRVIDVPGTRSMHIVGSAHGWLLYATYSMRTPFLLLNPVTNSRISLPEGDHTGMGSLAVISADPATTTDHPERVVVMYTIDGALVFCRATDSTWSVIKTGAPYMLKDQMRADMIAFGGKIYILTSDNRFGVVDVLRDPCEVNWLIYSSPIRSSQQRKRCRSRFLVESSGDVLMVLIYIDFSLSTYKADMVRMTWVAMPHHGNCLLFLGKCGSLCVPAPPGMRGGEVYTDYPGVRRSGDFEVERFPQARKDLLWKWRFTNNGYYWHWMLPSL